MTLYELFDCNRQNGTNTVNAFQLPFFSLMINMQLIWEYGHQWFHARNYDFRKSNLCKYIYGRKSKITYFSKRSYIFDSASIQFYKEENKLEILSVFGKFDWLVVLVIERNIVFWMCIWKLARNLNLTRTVKQPQIVINILPELIQKLFVICI